MAAIPKRGFGEKSTDGLLFVFLCTYLYIEEKIKRNRKRLAKVKDILS